MPDQLKADAESAGRRRPADLTLTELIELCEGRINALSRTRQAFEHSSTPEQVARLIADLGVTAPGWDVAVDSLPDGDPGAVRAGARSIRTGAPGFAAVAGVLDTYASTLESGLARHAAGVASLRLAQRRAEELPAAGRPDGVDPARVELMCRAALAVIDVACAGYAACQDAYEAVRDAEKALYAALSHVRVRRSGEFSDLSV